MKTGEFLNGLDKHTKRQSSYLSFVANEWQHLAAAVGSRKKVWRLEECEYGSVGA